VKHGLCASVLVKHGFCAPMLLGGAGMILLVSSVSVDGVRALLS
jgi:hypothetical protein